MLGGAVEPERQDLSFESGGQRCAAWLFRPAGAVRPPVVVLGHGFGATRDMGLEAPARAFARAGLAALAFDYRHFGESEGSPRGLVSVARQLEDWRAALAAVRAREDLDGERVGLWGSSFGGGHAIVTAARDRAVRAAVAQVPHVDPRASTRGVPLRWQLRALGLGLLDRLGAALGRPPIEVPIVAPPGRFCVLASPSSYEGYLALVPEGSRWRNAVPARSILELARYRPASEAGAVRCPLLLLAARDDDLIPLRAVEEVASRAPGARLEVVPGGHFDVYRAPLQERVLEIETRFLVEHLRPGGGD